MNIESKAMRAGQLAGKRASNRASNRDAILEAARGVFAELGYGGATVRDIIRRTELATGTFYNYFASKEEVFQALTQESGEELRQLLSQARKKADNFEQFIEASYLTYFTFYADNPETYRLVRSNRGRDGYNSNMKGPQVTAGLAEMRQDIERAMKLGMIPENDAAFLTAAIGGVAFSILDEMMEGNPAEPLRAARFATELFMRGIDGAGE
ncbi:MAG: TetR/AcrR family transcriptional regulator [PS1 clade bacterium]|uniref:TetR/AcrR family transcriptional regulator n=1 Tax=PS1 clade bacterium TaxID=2175152 RepID=A0A937HIH7_9PROT|nr:TetR/AcrR family transcriptional regulator [PS1 clade bacterium]